MTDINNSDQEAIFAEEAFVVDIQSTLFHLMEQKGMSKADLARAMNVSRPRVTQIFADDCKNFTIRLLARAMHAMGETPEISCTYLQSEIDSQELRQCQSAVAASKNVQPLWADSTDETRIVSTANDNRLNKLVNVRRHKNVSRMVA